MTLHGCLADFHSFPRGGTSCSRDGSVFLYACDGPLGHIVRVFQLVSYVVDGSVGDLRCGFGLGLRDTSLVLDLVEIRSALYFEDQGQGSKSAALTQ